MKSLMVVLALMVGLIAAPAASAHHGRVFITAGVGNVAITNGFVSSAIVAPNAVFAPVVVPQSLSFFSASNPTAFVSQSFVGAPLAVVSGGNQVVVRQGLFGGRRVVVNNGFGAANVVVGNRVAVVVNNGAVAVRAGRANVVVGGGQRVIVRRRGLFR